MKTLLNDENVVLAKGSYAFKADGALEIQSQFGDEVFSTMTDGVVTEASDFILKLPACALKVVNAGANSLIISEV